MKKSIILITIILLITGCYNYRELNDLAIIDALGIDYKDNKFLVTAQILNVEKKETDDTKKLIVVYEGEGQSIAEAIRNMSLDDPKEMYLGHLELIILGESLTKDNTNKVFEFLLRDPKLRSEALVVSSLNNSAREILNQKVNSNIFPSKSIINSIEVSSKTEGTVKKQTLEDLIKITLDNKIDSVITTISIKEEKENKEDINEYNLIKLDNLAIIKDKKIIDYLSKDEARIFNIIKNDIGNVMINIPFQDTNSVILLSNPKSNIKIKLHDKKIDVDINIEVDGDIAEINKKTNVDNQEILKKLSKELNKKLENDTKILLKKCKENDADILGLKDLIYKKYPKKYQNYQDNNIYEIANFNINVTSNIYKEGNITEGI
jgi:spore germination protein KC